MECSISEHDCNIQATKERRKTMMDYCARESTTCEGTAVETPRVETTVKEQLETISKKLYETDLCLRSIIDGLICTSKKEDLIPMEEKCMQDSLFVAHQLTDDCMTMSHRIKELLF